MIGVGLAFETERSSRGCRERMARARRLVYIRTRDRKLERDAEYEKHAGAPCGATGWPCLTSNRVRDV